MRIIVFLLCLSVSACSTTKQEAPSIKKTVDISSIRPSSEIIASSTSDDWIQLDPENTLYIDVPDGRIVIALSSALAQNHVKQIKTLAHENYFDGLTFYRVIEGFVAQAGDRGENRDIGTAADSVNAEFDQTFPAGLNFTPLGNDDGYAEQNSAGGTIYITIQPQRYLDRNLSVVGRVVWGMEHVQSIQRASQSSGGIIDEPEDRTKIISMKVASDVDEDERTNIEIFNTDSPLFLELIESRRNRPEEFFYYRPNYVDLCQMPIPVREVEERQ